MRGSIITLCILCALAASSELRDGSAEALRPAETVANATVDEEKATAAKEARSFVFAGAQRRLQSNSSTNGTSRDTQLLSLLAARRRQILTDRLNAHIATIASLAQKPYRGNGTHAHLEILDKNNTVISKITIPENNSNVKFQWDVRNINIKSVPRLEESKSSDNKSITLLRGLQDAKTTRAGYLINRRKLPLDGFRFGAGPRKSHVDLQISSEESNNFKKTDLPFPYDKKQDYENAEALLEPEEEFQVDESNHGFYLLNYTAENMTRAVYNDTPNDVELIELKLPLFGNDSISRIIDDTENLINRNAKDEYHNLSQSHPRASEMTPLIPMKIQDTRTNKEMKVDSGAKETDNNTLFISDELYKHFRPLESELPVEDMEPFLFFGQKLNIDHLQKNNISFITNVSPSTKTVQYLTTPEKKRNLFRIPVTEKTKYFNNDEDEEINEDMDVSVVKNIIEKNKVRNNIKQLAPVRDSGLINAYRKSSITTTMPPMTTSLPAENVTLSAILNQTEIVDIDETVASESRLRVKENVYNRSATIIAPRVNRTYTFRRKPAKIISLNSTHSSDSATVANSTLAPQSTTLVYTAVVTSVSITSSIKGQNHTDVKNDTQIDNKQIPEEVFIERLHNNTAKVLSQIESTTSKDYLSNSTQIPILNVSDPTEVRIRKRPEFRHRPHRIRRISTTEKTITLNLADASSTPFVLYPSDSNIENNISTNKFDTEVTTEATSQQNATDIDYKKRVIKNESLSIGTPILIPDEPLGQGLNKIGPNIFSDQSTSVKPVISLKPVEYNKTAIQITLSDKKLHENIPKIEDFGGNVLNTSSENSSYYYTDSTTTELVFITELKGNISNTYSTLNRTVNDNNTTSNGTVDNGKELLSSKTGDVIIEAGNTNVATYILAALGFVPIAAIIFVVMRNIILRKTKDMDTEYEGYFQDPDLKKDAQVTPVARPPTQPHKKPDEKWEFPRSKLRLQTLLGQGNFGQVWKAEADDLKGHDGLTRLVAVKTIKETASQKEKQELLHEICIMQKIGTHPNVVTLLACCTEQEPYLLIMEYVMCGKLLTYLRERRSRPDRFGGASGTLTSRDLTVFAYCVARGMEYLASKGVVHRDLAARNILVDHNKLCKIADFGMSREVVSTDGDGGSGGECGRSQRHALPVRWMAPEALLYNIYSHETDVWAYGVLLWEIVTLGSTPYASMTGRQVLHMVTEGYRLERPAHCKPHLYRTMHACWHADPSHRPPFSEIKKQLAELLDNEPTEGHYVDLESFYQDSSVYSDPSAIIQNDGGISIEYSRELKPQAMTEEPKRRSFNQIAAACNLQRNHSSSFGSRSGFNDDFINLRSNSHGSKIGATRMGGFGISNIAFNARESDFGERKDKLSGLSFQNRDRENNILARDSTGIASRNSFSTSYQNRHGGREGGRGYFVNSGSNRSKRMTEFECNI